MAEETKIEIPNFSYPFKLKIEEEYYTALSSVTSGNYLFNDKGMWHGGIHFADQALTTVDSSKGIKAIADGELVAYRINDKYLQNSDEENEDEGLYSNGFFLIRHKIEYATSKLTFFSLYMHTAKKEDYYTHKIIGNPEYLRKTINGGDVHSLNSVAKDKKIVLDTKWTKRRAKVLYLEDAIINETEPAYVHESNIEVINEQESFSSISTILSGNMNSVVILATPIKVKAGDIIGLVGEYNLSTKKDNKLLHLEVFTSDDVKAFASSAKNTFNTDTNENKLKPNKLKIPKGKTIYNLSKKLFVNSSKGYTNLRKAYNNTEDGYNTIKKLNHDEEIKIDISSLNSNRYLITFIGTTDIKNQNWTIHKNYYKERTIFEDSNTRQLKDKVLNISDVKKVKDKDDKEYVLLDDTKAVLLSDCEQTHGITFDWAEILNSASEDKVSIFKNLKDIINPMSRNEIEENSLFKDIFKQIDKNSNNQIEAIEISEAVLNKDIKEYCSKYIVKHSSEWDNKINLPEELLKIINSLDEQSIRDKEEVIKHLENEKRRVNKLAFFDDCKSIASFPQSDEVCHFNPIGLIGEFGKSGCGVNIDNFMNKYKKNHHSIIGWYNKDKTTGKYVKGIISKLNSISESNLKKLIKGLISYYKTSNYKCSIPKLAYILATIRLESYQYRKQEFFGITEEDISYDQSEIDYGCGKTARRKKDAMLNGCLFDGDGYKYRGRGFVQITWKINYKKFNNIKEINFVNEPEKMLDFDIQIAVTIEGMEQGLFSEGNTLSEYISDTKKDYLGARAIINSNDKDWIIDFYAKEIEKCLLK